ncbi:hypothetical protein [Amycolatopsis sp. lyj-108]|uniref:hypothetical protein n=1 Tax=Amycolatopsis sp. lyj-108 TaxID=2789286 RepID=UPI00397BADA0
MPRTAASPDLSSGNVRSKDAGAPRILGRSWLFGALDGHGPDRDMIDAAVPDRPVCLAADDLHSTWVTGFIRRLLLFGDSVSARHAE